jgi:hypothetical protein
MIKHGHFNYKTVMKKSRDKILNKRRQIDTSDEDFGLSSFIVSFLR